MGGADYRGRQKKSQWSGWPGSQHVDSYKDGDLHSAGQRAQLLQPWALFLLCTGYFKSKMSSPDSLPAPSPLSLSMVPASSGL